MLPYISPLPLAVGYIRTSRARNLRRDGDRRPRVTMTASTPAERMEVWTGENAVDTTMARVKE